MNWNLRHTGYVTLVIFCLSSCKAWDASMVRINESPIQPKLPALEKEVIDFATQKNLVLTDELKTIHDEIEKNIIIPTGEKKGTIKVTRRHLKIQRGWAFIATSIYTTGLLNIVGFPFASYNSKIEIEVEIKDLKGNLIKKYNEVGDAKERNLVALYYGYSIRAAKTKAFSEAISDAFSKIYPKIQTDLLEINTKLK